MKDPATTNSLLADLNLQWREGKSFAQNAKKRRYAAKDSPANPKNKKKRIPDTGSAQRLIDSAAQAPGKAWRLARGM